VILAASGEPQPPADQMIWATAAGVSGVAGLAFFYFALSRGTMGVIAPLAALIGAGLPVFVSIAAGADVPPARLVGITIALGAVVLISLPGGEQRPNERRAVRIDLAELPLVLLAGLGFAGFFLFIDRASAGGATWWPQMIVRVVGVGMVVAVLLARLLRGGTRPWPREVAALLGIARFRASGRSLLSVLPLLALAGAGDLGGNSFFLLAKQADAFAVAVVLSSLYPVVTTVLAVVFLHERLRLVQGLGVALAAVGIALMA
jgi:drug/metabolite transporter (DMT)-like permease